MPTTAQVAKIANVSLQSVRNWTRQYPELFTPEARGEAADGVRLFSDRDVEVMCAIADLRKSGVPSSEVIARINNGDVPPIVDIEATPHESPHEAPTAPHEAQEAPLATQTVLSSLNARFEGHDRLFEALQRQLDTQAAQQRAERHDRLWTLGLGILIGMVAAMVLFVVAYLLLTVGR